MNELEICLMPVVEMANAVKTKKLSPVEIMTAVLQRIERLNPKINAYCTLVAETAIQQAREAEAKVMRGEKLGALHGIPVSIKDLIYTKGIRTTGGSRFLENFVPQQDAIVVERLKNAGAIVIGKTNTPEFGWLGITQNALFGVTRNPWHLNRTTGGSSGGAAASVAAGMGPLAIGTDVGGSIRIPSSFCGTVGFKPSFGRAPKDLSLPTGQEAIYHTGPITRTVSDAALTMEVIAGRDDRDIYSLPETGLRFLPYLNGDLKGLRVAWSKDLGIFVVDPQVASITEAAIRTFANFGCHVEAASPPVDSPEKFFTTITATCFATFMQDLVAKTGLEIDPLMAKFIERNKAKTVEEYIRAANIERLRFWNDMRPFFEKYDLLLTPTVAVPAFEIGSYGPREIAGVKVGAFGWWPFTCQWDLTGQPAITVPCGWTTDGLPVGLQIIGRRFDDVTVLKAAALFEKAAPWADKVPPVD